MFSVHTIIGREAKKVKEKIKKMASAVENEEFDGDLEMVCNSPSQILDSKYY